MSGSFGGYFNSTAAFDPSHFVKQWKGLSDEAKSELFRGSGRASYRNDLDRLARISDNLKKYRRQDNHSNTGKWSILNTFLNPLSLGGTSGAGLGAMMGGATGAAMVGAGGLAAGAAVKGVNAGARRYQAAFLTNPRTVNWLADLPQAEMAKGGVKAHVSKLLVIGREAGMRTAVADYLREVGFADEADQLDSQQQ